MDTLETQPKVLWSVDGKGDWKQGVYEHDAMIMYDFYWVWMEMGMGLLSLDIIHMHDTIHKTSWHKRYVVHLLSKAMSMGTYKCIIEL